MSNRLARRVRAKKEFLRTLSETRNVSLSIRASGVCPKTIYKWRSESTAFSDAWRKAIAKSRESVHETP